MPKSELKGEKQKKNQKTGNLIRRKWLHVHFELLFVCFNERCVAGDEDHLYRATTFLHGRQSAPGLITHHENKTPSHHFKHCLSVWFQCLLVLHLPLPLLNDGVRSLAGATGEAGQVTNSPVYAFCGAYYVAHSCSLIYTHMQAAYTILN